MRDAAEQATVDCFLKYLEEHTGHSWSASEDEVSTFKNERSYDCEYTFPRATAVAAEIGRLFPLGYDLGELARRQTYNERFLSQLRREGFGGLLIEQPTVDPHPEAAATRLGEELRLREGTRMPMHGVERFGNNSELSAIRQFSASAIRFAEMGGHPLAKLLVDKHDQLDVDNHQRFLIVVNQEGRVSATDLIDACATIVTFHRLPNFDRIYFEQSPGTFHLVYDRSAWLAMEAGKLPSHNEGDKLVAQWMETRLAGNWPGAVEAAFQISQVHGMNWLSKSGQETFHMDSQRFMYGLFSQHPDCEAPRRLWEMFRGTRPFIAIPKARPIFLPPCKGVRKANGIR